MKTLSKIKGRRKASIQHFCWYALKTGISNCDCLHWNPQICFHVLFIWTQRRLFAFCFALSYFKTVGLFVWGFFVTSTLQEFVSWIQVLRIGTLQPQQHSAGGDTASALLDRAIASYWDASNRRKNKKSFKILLKGTGQSLKPTQHLV